MFTEYPVRQGKLAHAADDFTLRRPGAINPNAGLSVKIALYEPGKGDEGLSMGVEV